MRWIGIAMLGVLFAPSGQAEGPEFEVVSVKLLDPHDPGRGGRYGGPGTSDPGRFTLTGFTMNQLLSEAFGQSRRIAPSWVNQFPPANFYTFVAIMPPETTKEQFQKMLQNVLVERFHMVMHHEMRNFPAFNLVVDRGGPKIQEIPADSNSGPTTSSNTPTKRKIGPDGFLVLPGSRCDILGTREGTQRMKCQESPMELFAAALEPQIAMSINSNRRQDVRVINKTGLPGAYSFIFEYWCAGCPTYASFTSASDAASDPGGGAPKIFPAIRKQLGLRLEEASDVPTDVIVIDSLDKVPTPD